MEVARNEYFRDEGNRRVKRGKVATFEFQPPSAVITAITQCPATVYVLACFTTGKKSLASQRYVANTFNDENQPYRSGMSVLFRHFNAEISQIVTHGMRTGTT